MMRPVKNLSTNDIEYIGTMEQCYLHVCVKPEEFVENVIINVIYLPEDPYLVPRINHGNQYFSKLFNRGLKCINKDLKKVFGLKNSLLRPG
jgi:hypothetical protein